MGTIKRGFKFTGYNIRNINSLKTSNTYNVIIKENKKCISCNNEIEKFNFYKNRSSPDGYSYNCKKCDIQINNNIKKRKKLNIIEF